MTGKTHKWLIPVVIFMMLITVQFIFIAAIVVPARRNDVGFLNISSLAAVLFSAAIDILIIKYISNSRKLYELEKEEELKSNLEHLDKKYREIMENELAQSRELRMELLNHIKEFRSDISNGIKGNTDTIKAISKDAEDFHTLKYCEEPTVDMVLMLKKNRADSESIPIVINAVVPADVNISKLDLSSVVSNMTDNALEAAIQASEAGIEPYVNVNIALKGGFLVIRTENPTSFDGKINDIEDLKTTKKADSGIHGYGLKILQNICDRYDGEMTVDISDHISVFTVMMGCERTGAAV